MTIRNQSKTSVFTCRVKGEQNQGWNRSDPFSNVWGTFNVVTSSISTNSISSNTAFTKQKIVVPYRTKTGKSVNKPTFPTLRLPFRPFMLPRRPNQSKRSFERVLQKFQAKLAIYETKVLLKKQRHAIILAKYYKRMEAYDLYLQRMKYGVVRNVRVKTETTRKLPWNPYSRTISYISPLSGSYYWTRNQLVGWPQFYIKEWQIYTGHMNNWPSGSVNLSYPSFSTSYTNAIAAANSKALTRLHGRLGEQAVHIGNLIAERQQTVSLIKTNLERLVKLVTGFSWKRLGNTAIETLSVHKNKQLAGQTLEFLFGVKPLVNDIHEAVKQLSESDDGNIVIVRASAKSTDNVTEVVKISESLAVNNLKLCTDTFQSTITVKVAYVLQYTISSDLASALQKWGLVNPAEVLWEKMPWSFVIDWVLPIGNYIRSFTSDIGLQFVQGSKVTTTTVSHKVIRNYNDKFYSNQYNGWSNGKWEGTYVTQTKTREILSTPPKLQFPSFKSPISFYHILESLALLRQKLR